MPNIIAEIAIPDNAPVVEHKKGGAKYIDVPFLFPDGTPGHMVLIKGVKMAWQPSDDIENVTINFK